MWPTTQLLRQADLKSLCKGATGSNVLMLQALGVKRGPVFGVNKKY
jgi:hypothetical protein